MKNVCDKASVLLHIFITLKYGYY